MMTVLMADGVMCSGAPKQRTIEGKHNKVLILGKKKS
jgi:hypothetical protein